MWRHIYPLQDTQPHSLQWAPTAVDAVPCPCRHHIDWASQTVIHESWDCREALVEACNLVGPPAAKAATPAAPVILESRQRVFGPLVFTLLVTGQAAFYSLAVNLRWFSLASTVSVKRPPHA